jgi:hypothetical protein
MTAVFHTGAAAGGVVTAQCLLASATTGARSTLSQLTTVVDSTGRWQLDLTPNIQVKPAGSFWEIFEPTALGDPNIFNITVPPQVGQGGLNVTQVPVATGSGAGTKPTITGSRGSATAAVLASLLAALAAEGLIINNTTA